VITAGVLAIGLIVVGHPVADAAARPGGSTTPVITSVSSRADLVAGDEALLQISVPQDQGHRQLTVSVGGRDETSAFVKQADGTLLGLVTGLRQGTNNVTATYPDGSGAQLTLTAHPQGGPLFSGPQIQPWTCQQGATDAQCDQPLTFSYMYKSTNASKTALQAYDPANPPADVATTTANGATVPFIVRIETGYVDRDQYSVATLYNPKQPWTAAHPQAQYAHKLLVTHGAGCGIAYSTATAPSTTSDQVDISPELKPDSAVWALSQGWAVMSTAMDNAGHDCNLVTEAESLLMAKEHVIDSYDTLKYTVGVGCSGGSLAVNWIGNAYPGIYQGIITSCTFPDAWSSGTQPIDFHLLDRYFGATGPATAGVSWTPAQEAAAEDIPSEDLAVPSEATYPVVDPSSPCPGTTDQDRYNPATNPGGVRCSMADFDKNVLGTQPKSDWGPEEKALGYGFGALPYSNVGVEYGLSALTAGTITPAQFVDLNVKVGGLDPETMLPQAARNTTDPAALSRAYRSGMINEANNLGQLAVIDCRGPQPTGVHDSYRSFALRDRLDQANGTHGNELLWEGPVPLFGSTNCHYDALKAMDSWLTKVSADNSDRSLAAKIIAGKPATLTDRCYNLPAGNTTDLNWPAQTDWTGPAQQVVADNLCGPGVVPVFGTPRMGAGEAVTTDIIQCQLKPLDRADYAATFTDAEWAQLKRVFPSGVCNYSKPGVGQQDTIPWQTYQTASGQVITGGQPMGPAPVSTPVKLH
jgi:hypothetical protein